MRSFGLRGAVVSLALLPAALGCGGSSSETPPPLPPHPLHEAYRSPGAVVPARKAAAAAEPADVESEPESSSPEGAPAPGGGSQTWGSDTPPPLPETQIK